LGFLKAAAFLRFKCYYYIVNNFKYILIVIFTVIFVLGLVFIYNFFKPKVNSPYDFNVSGTAVVKELRALKRLETSSFTIEKVIDAGTNSNQLKEFFGDRLLLIAQGEVIAGFNLEKLSEKDIKVDKGTLTLNLPKPEILISRLDSEKTRVYDRKQGLLTQGDKDLESEARAQAEQLIRAAACSERILDEASNNARSQLAALFKTLGFTTIIINIPETSC
jgi:hypothetical protein